MVVEDSPIPLPIPVVGGGGAGARLGSPPVLLIAGVEVDVRRAPGPTDEDAEESVDSGFVGFLRYAGAN